MADSGDKPDIETGADTLLSFLEEKSKWPVSRIAEDLGVPEETIKKWAKALEKSGLVEIKYSAIKGMVLEYSSDKSYEELNRGRSELELEADELEIEAEEVETIKDEGEMSETKHAENKEATEQPEQTEETATGPEQEQAEKEDSQEKEFSEKLEGFDTEDEGSSPESGLSEEEGKQKLKDELENLEQEKKEQRQEEKKKTKLDAKKAKIKEKGRGQRKQSSRSDTGRGDEGHVDKVQEKVKRGSSGDASDHETGGDFEEHLENLKQLGDLLRDKEVENGDIYAKMDKEMEDLKHRLVREEVDDDMRERVSGVMEKLESDIENAEEPKGFLESLKDRILEAVPWQK